MQREKSSHAYKLSLNVQTACSTDSLNNCPKHSILRFSTVAVKYAYDIHTLISVLEGGEYSDIRELLSSGKGQRSQSA